MDAMTEGQVFEALRARYAAPAWALLPQVADRTGAYASRAADALAVGLWPSRGLDVIGFEIKVSRSDWLRELRQPAKAEPMVAICDTWWIAAGESGLVKSEELPGGWGLLEVTATGKLRTVTVAARRPTHPDVPN